MKNNKEKFKLQKTLIKELLYCNRCKKFIVIYCDTCIFKYTDSGFYCNTFFHICKRCYDVLEND